MSRRKAVDVLPCWMMEAFRSSYPCDLERWCRMRDMLLAILSLSLLQCGSPSDPPSNGSDGADGGGGYLLRSRRRTANNQHVLVGVGCECAGR